MTVILTAMIRNTSICDKSANLKFPRSAQNYTNLIIRLAEHLSSAFSPSHVSVQFAKLRNGSDPTTTLNRM